MKHLTTASVCSALIIASVAILGVTVSVTTSADVTKDSQLIVPFEPNAEFYACFIFPYCFDPENAKPVHHQPELAPEKTVQQV